MEVNITVVAPADEAPFEADCVTTDVTRATEDAEAGAVEADGVKAALDEATNCDEEAKVVGGVEEAKVGEVNGTGATGQQQHDEL